MIIKDIRSRWFNKTAILSAKIQPDSWLNKPLRVWFLVEGIKKLPYNSGDPFLAGFLLPCMYEHEDLKIEAPVSKVLLNNIYNIQNIMSGWYPDLSKIRILCDSFTKFGLEDDNKGVSTCFFSGGVDSSYTLLKHKNTITHLILIHGFDIKLSNKELWSEALNSTQKISREFGKSIITAKTNIRTLADKRRANWGKKYNGDFWGKILFGSLLASVGLCLQSNLDSILIASGGRTGKDLRPWGSHPDLDSLWSTERLKFRHDALMPRTSKIEYISDYPVILNNLRVCYQNKRGKINCGACEKCIRTIISLKLCGETPSPDVFAKIPTTKQIKLCRINLNSPVVYLWNQLLDKAISQGDLEIANAIKIALGKKFSFYRCLMLTLQSIKSLYKKYRKLFYKSVRIILSKTTRKRIKYVLNKLKIKIWKLLLQTAYL
jgi:hypothetical protein